MQLLQTVSFFPLYLPSYCCLYDIVCKPVTLQVIDCNKMYSATGLHGWNGCAAGLLQMSFFFLMRIFSAFRDGWHSKGGIGLGFMWLLLCIVLNHCIADGVWVYGIKEGGKEGSKLYLIICFRFRAPELRGGWGWVNWLDWLGCLLVCLLRMRQIWQKLRQGSL